MSLKVWPLVFSSTKNQENVMGKDKKLKGKGLEIKMGNKHIWVRGTKSITIFCFLFFFKNLGDDEWMKRKRKQPLCKSLSFSFPMKNGCFFSLSQCQWLLYNVFFLFRNFVFEVSKVGYFCSRQMQGESTTRMCLRREINFEKFP